MQGLLPPDILARPKKGFGLPISAWLRDWEPPPLNSVEGLNTEAIARYWSEHKAGAADHRILLWCWLALAYGAGTMRSQAALTTVARRGQETGLVPITVQL